jgi:hypothetical protein
MSVGILPDYEDTIGAGTIFFCLKSKDSYTLSPRPMLAGWVSNSVNFLNLTFRLCLKDWST